jgi:hypothetical protein
MNRDRKGVLLMLTVAVFWAAMPASACLLGARNTNVPNCCRKMTQGCGKAGMSADSACCRIHGKIPAVTPVPPYSPEHVQKLALAPYQNLNDMELNFSSGAGYANALEAPPPQFPPGGAFALRI